MLKVYTFKERPGIPGPKSFTSGTLIPKYVNNSLYFTLLSCVITVTFKYLRFQNVFAHLLSLAQSDVLGVFKKYNRKMTTNRFVFFSLKRPLARIAFRFLGCLLTLKPFVV